MSLFHSPASRWTASVTHLLLSILLIGSIALFAFLHWYPAGLHHAAKLDKLMGIMLGVDIVAGPLLTLILYRRGKKGLKIDLATIAVLQLAFLGYGLNTLWQSRPIFLVGSQEAFALIFAPGLPPDIEEQAIKEKWPRFRNSGPWLAAVDLSGRVARDEFLTSAEHGNSGPLAATALYIPYSKLSSSIAAAAHPLGEDITTTGRETRSSIRTLHLMSSQTDQAVVLLDAASGEPLRIALPDGK